MSEFRRRLMMAAGKKVLPNYLCFTALEASTISKTGTYAASLEYSTDGSTWSTFDNNSTINLSTGDSVYFRGNNTRLGSSTSAYTNFVMTGSLDGSGNIMSLLSTTGFDSVTSIPNQYCFIYLFNGCTALRTAPSLPATTMKQHCYRGMFQGCSSLTAAPDLYHITTLDNRCCQDMFNGCSSLTSASIPSAKTVKGYCYYQMYYGCSSLASFPNYYATNAEDNACCAMFRGCTNLVTVPESLAGMGGSCYKQMFYGCNKITKAPELKASSASSSYCYQEMFRGASTLAWIKMLAVTVSGSGALSNWVNGVQTTSGVFVKHIDATWTTTGNNGVPTNWTIIYYDPSDDKYYTDQTKDTECDDHGNPI